MKGGYKINSHGRKFLERRKEKMFKKIHDIFGPGSNLQGRIFKDYDQLTEKIASCKQLGLKIVLTSGTFDLFHVGHNRYLEQAKQHGDVLVVGVDSDEKVKKKKGPNRPIVNEKERTEILCHSRHVDIVFLKNAKDPKWHFIKTIQPDVLISSQREYKKEDLDSLHECCRKIVVLESQATTSTTAKIRSILISPANEIKGRLETAIKEVYSFIDSLTGGVS